MRILLDENLPKRLKIDFAEHEVFTVSDMGWTGYKNGQLLSAMLESGFGVLLTFDKNVEFQLNFEKYPLTVIILVARINTYSSLTSLSEKVKLILGGSAIPKGPIVVQ